MFDCSTEILNFHNKAVTLSEEIRGNLRGHRQANQDRLKKGLDQADKPKPIEFVKQGSYAMRTMVQHKNSDYDIDDGAVFDAEKLGQKSALDARKMVCDAIQDNRFKTPPEVKNNCVRVYYEEGHHVDIPVYRTTDTDFGYELASTDWRESNPTGVNKWFADRLSTRSDAGHQMRRQVRLLKKFARSRDSWNLPSGFALTVLIDESYIEKDEREDRAFYKLLVEIKNRLLLNKHIQHPVIDESLSEGKENRVEELEDKVIWAIEKLSEVHDQNCTRLKALKVWKTVFNTDFFDADIEEESEKASIKEFQVMSGNPSDPVDKKGGGRYGKPSVY